MSFADWIVEPLRFPFMVRGLIAAMSVGGLCAIVGSFIVLRGMAFMGDAIAHSILPGFAGGVLAAGRGGRRGLFWWALGTAILVALGIGWVSERGRVREDTAIGIVFAGMFALGVALISTVRGFAVDLVQFLFGNVLGCPICAAAVYDDDLDLVGGIVAPCGGDGPGNVGSFVQRRDDHRDQGCSCHYWLPVLAIAHVRRKEATNKVDVHVGTDFSEGVLVL